MAPTDVLRVAVALSGGRDSMALLDTLARDAPALHIAPSAVHVHHGLSGNADAWATFCGDECSRRGIALEVVRVEVPRVPRTSREATARTARYDVLLRAAADVVMLAHHADDQAETLLLQLLRGAGPQGLSAMPRLRASVGASAGPGMPAASASIAASWSRSAAASAACAAARTSVAG